ncbi:MAG TPA: hypothetical protein VD884_19125 [Ohtaekwangia sp.]|nr:hypothetical protein [Ohtaekwangia sp.]
MKEKLEDFIRANRSAFDDKEPAENGWEVVASSLPKANGFSLWNSVMLWRAAAIVFMVISVYLIIPKANSLLEADNSKMSLKEFQAVEQYYNQEISQKVKLISEISDGEEGNAFTHDLQQLDAMYQVLKEEMKNSPSKQVKDALVLNLLVRINLLNQQLHRLEADYKSEESSV